VEILSSTLSDGGGIRGLSELVILQEVMNRIQFQLNLANTPLPCDHFDMIGGTGTGGYVIALNTIIHSCRMLKRLPISSIIALMLGRLRMSVDQAIVQYGTLVQSFRDVRMFAGDGAFSATKFEEVIKEIVKERTRNPDEPMMDPRSEGVGCKTCVVSDHSLMLCS
jgi:hypothetical protein